MYSKIQILIENISFPIAISVYSLTKIKTKLQELSYIINEFSKDILSIKK
ncbi:YvrJ family protein [Paraclostridium bifermentans]|uniref:YvrJ family protein n=1 Tax=Paraclostridium bifermentans TaxID=1490 RepID=A0A5P3XES2_PARBF|nr:YvrJ family protein [Paraclostridium bifermentans]QEZ68491.1 YvrJ family protein [Paraclostridium bifermentans]